MSNLTHPFLDTEDNADILVEYQSGAIGTFLFTNSQPNGFYTGGLVTGSKGYAEVQTDESMFVAGPGANATSSVCASAAQLASIV